MSAPSASWTSIACSGVKRWIDPSRWLRNVTPSSSTTRRSPERHDLEAARVGQDRPVPGHEPVQAAEPLDPLVARPQVEVVRVGQDDRRADLDEVVGMERLDRRVRADRHELGRLDDAVGQRQPAEPRPRRAVGRRRDQDLERRRPRRASTSGHGLLGRLERRRPPRAAASRPPACVAAGSRSRAARGERGRPRSGSGPAASDRGSPAAAGTARRRPRSSRPPRTARRPAPPRRPARCRTSGRSRPSACGRWRPAPRRRSPSPRIASSAAASSIRPSPWTWAWSRVRLSSRLTIARRAASAPGDRVAAPRLDLDPEDPGRALDDRGEVRLLVEVEPIGGPEPIPERARDPAGAGGRADDVNGLRVSRSDRADGPLPIITSSA